MTDNRSSAATEEALEKQARELLAAEYEQGAGDGRYPEYADLARSGNGAFTLCSIRAVMAALRLRTLAQPPKVSIEPMYLSGDRVDYFVAIRVGDRVVTPHVFREEYKAAYHVALYDWLLNGNGEEPDCVEFSPDDWPARVQRSSAGSARHPEGCACDRCQGRPLSRSRKPVKLSTEIIGFDDAGAGDDHPVKGVTVGHIRRWFDQVEKLHGDLRAYEITFRRIAEEDQKHNPGEPQTAVNCSCASAGFPGSCDNCDADSGPIKYWRDRALRAEGAPEVPDGYRKLAPHLPPCRCPKLWRDENGAYWCCTAPDELPEGGK
jgi:hypothetical protein